MGPKRIPVHDDATVGDIPHTLLASEGYAAGEAKSGNQGLQALAAGPVDLVSMDIRMPDVGGSRDS